MVADQMVKKNPFLLISVSAGDHILFARTPSAMESYFDLCFSDFDHVLDAGSKFHKMAMMQ